ncbi:hypothetical protein [Crocinitomix catalasitica]|uniref:hypothetical protein n=1 Tax=Crocinitomix catalasitica TaxID=184607 RepID=UPI0012FAECAE|nr:hypothetical protein [Crocinitomix catalasitica]
MTKKSMIIHSKSRRSFKITFVLTLAIIFSIIWLLNNNSTYMILAGACCFLALLEYVVYGQTILELTTTQLKVQRKALLNTVNNEYVIELKNIQSSFYDKKIYDSWELSQRLFWELLFPSEQSYLIINILDGKKQEIPFNGNESELLKLQQKLPDRVPNSK